MDFASNWRFYLVYDDWELGLGMGNRYGKFTDFLRFSVLKNKTRSKKALNLSQIRNHSFS